MKKKISLFVLTLSFFLQIFISPVRVSAMDIISMKPNQADNAKTETEILVEGFNFKENSELYLYNAKVERKLKDVKIISENQIKAKLESGLDAGIYALRIESKDLISAILPNAIKIYGDYTNLRIEKLESEIIKNNVVRYSIETNVPIKAKARMGDSYPDEMKVVMKKSEYSKKHILTFVFDPDSPRYQMADITLKSERGEEISLLRTLKLTENGVRIIEKESFSYNYPYLLKDKDGLIFNINANEPIKVKIEYKEFLDSNWIILSESPSYNKENKIWFFDPDTLKTYYFKVSAKTEDEKNSFEKEFKLYHEKLEEIEEVQNLEKENDESIEKTENIDDAEEQIIIDENYLEKQKNKKFEVEESFYDDFDDTNNWAVSYALKLAETGIIRDYDPQPKRHITNKEVALMLYRKLTAEGVKTESQESYFTDVPKTDPVHEALSFLVNKKITQGYNDGTFRPDEKITVKDAIIMVLKSLNFDLDKEDGLKFVLEKNWIDKIDENSYLTRDRFFKLFSLGFDMSDTIEITSDKLQMTNKFSSDNDQTENIEKEELEIVEDPAKLEERSGEKLETGNSEDEEEMSWDDLESLLGNLI
jgi:hypothetical protein